VTVFRRVTLPLIGPGIAAGAVLAWARALGEFGATILAEITPSAVADLDLRPGSEVWAAVKASDIEVYSWSPRAD